MIVQIVRNPMGSLNRAHMAERGPSYSTSPNVPVHGPDPQQKVAQYSLPGAARREEPLTHPVYDDAIAHQGRWPPFRQGPRDHKSDAPLEWKTAGVYSGMDSHPLRKVRRIGRGPGDDTRAIEAYAREDGDGG